MSIAGLLLALLAPSHAQASDTFDIPLAQDTQVTIERFAATGEALVLWIPSEYGNSPQQTLTAEGLALRGLAVWIADLHSAYFVPVGRQSLESIPLEDMVHLIEIALERSAKPLILLSSGRGAALALQAARQWQKAHAGDTRLRGLILIHPHVYEGVPQAGQDAHYLPISQASNLPVYLIQPTLSGKYWHLMKTAEQLEHGGAPVFVQPLPGVTDGFHMRRDEDLTDKDKTARAALPRILAQAWRLLSHYPTPMSAAPLPPPESQAPVNANPVQGLPPYAGMPPAPAMALHDADGRLHSLSDYRGQVVLVSFWATWCPPCVKELPALQHLNDTLHTRPFTLLAVNIGEDRETLAAFLQKVPLSLTILRDANGVSVRPWRVYAYPSNYLLDAQGRIRYAGYGAVDWETPEIQHVINNLLDEAAAS